MSSRDDPSPSTNPSTDQPATAPSPSDGGPAPTNRAARRKKGKASDPAADAARHHGPDGAAGSARASAQGRRVNPIRRTG